MHFNISLPGLEGVMVTKSFEQDGYYQLHVELARVPHHCPNCSQVTEKVHDYRVRKIQHHHIFGRQTLLFILNNCKVTTFNFNIIKLYKSTYSHH